MLDPDSVIDGLPRFVHGTVGRSDKIIDKKSSIGGRTKFIDVLLFQSIPLDSSNETSDG
jgi:hypothetical protein